MYSIIPETNFATLICIVIIIFVYALSRSKLHRVGYSIVETIAFFNIISIGVPIGFLIAALANGNEQHRIVGLEISIGCIVLYFLILAFGRKLVSAENRRD